VHSITYARRAELTAGGAFNAQLRASGKRVTTSYVNADDSLPNLDVVLSAVQPNDVVILGSYVNISSTTENAGAPPAFTALVDGLRARTRNVILVAFGSPYALLQAPSVPTYLVAWGGLAASQRAAARALAGDAAITATLPISIPPLLPFGAGEQRAANQGR
jgi:hypothetical protein